MTTGNNANRAAELLQNGIRLFREGRAPEAYGTFREVVNYDPNNEFGWIWLSVTSQDYGEKRAALERALQINPNSAHAREALRALNAEAPAPQAAVQPSFQESPTDQMRPVAPANNTSRRGLRDRIGERDAAPAEDLTQSLRQAPPSKKVSKVPPPPSSQLVSTTTAGQSFARSVRVGALVLLAVIVIALVVYFLYTKFANNPAPAPVAINTTAPATTQVATTPTIGTTTQASLTTVAADTPTAPVALIVSPTPPSGVNSVGTTTATTASATTVAGTAASVSTQVDNLLSTAQTSLAANDYKTALQSYKQALQLDPSNVQANFRLGLLYLSSPISQLNTTDPYGSAISAFKVVTDQDPTWAGGFAQLGAAYAAKGDLQNAINAYRTSLDLDPNGPERWLALASLYDRTNQAALASYARTRAQSLAQNQAAAVTTTATENVTTTTAATTTEAATATPVPPTPTPKPTATPTPAVPTPTFTPVVAAPPATPK